MVDTLKPFAYLYDVVHERLNEAMEANFGQLFELDIASIPDKWTPEQWLFYAKKNHLAIKDSFKEGNIGAATGKLAGNFASNSRGLIGTNTGDYIQQHWQMLEYIKNEMSDALAELISQNPDVVASPEELLERHFQEELLQEEVYLPCSHTGASGQAGALSRG